MRSYGIGIVRESYRDDSKFLFSFGAYGSTHVLVIGARGLEAALEAAADWLADNAPGHVMKEWGDAHTDLVREACEERGVSWEEFHDLADEEKWEICEEAESDLTRTESGFLTSYEWWVDENPTREQILERQRRHPYDTPGEWYCLSRADEYAPLEIVRCKRSNGERTTYIRPSGHVAHVRGKITLCLSNRDSALADHLESEYRTSHGARLHGGSL